MLLFVPKAPSIILDTKPLINEDFLWEENTHVETAVLTAQQQGARFSAQEKQDQHQRPWDSGLYTPTLQGQATTPFHP